MPSILSRAEFDAVCTENHVREKAESGKLVGEIRHDVVATNPRYPGGRSQIVVFKTVRGQHIGTVHRIVMPDGSTPHEHGKDYTMRDCSRVRAEEPLDPRR